MTLRRCCDRAARPIRHQVQVQSASRSASTSSTATKVASAAPSTSKRRSIAVLGAGISGLTHALHLARSLGAKDSHRIVVYESSDRVGGWVHSQRKHIPSTTIRGTTTGASRQTTPESAPLFEYGPRSIRAAKSVAGWSMLELIASLNLSKDLISVSSEHPSARNRLVYYGNTLQGMPSGGIPLLRSAFSRRHLIYKAGLKSAVYNYIKDLRSGRFTPSTKTDKWQDESVEDFLSRMVGDWKGKDKGDALPIVDYLLSAVMHGIYAADPSKLSARMVAPLPYKYTQLLYYDRKSWWPFPFGLRLRDKLDFSGRQRDEFSKVEVKRDFSDMAEAWSIQNSLGSTVGKFFEETSVLSFRNGIQTLTDAMHKECLERGVEFRLQTPVKTLTLQKGDTPSAVVKTAKGEETFHRVISALPSTMLDKMSQSTLPNLSVNPQTTVAVVNVAFAPHLNMELPPAFGFLVPRISAKQGDNPTGLLGIVYDSVAVPGQDECTKLTMMFGGPFWRSGFSVYDAYTQKANGKKRALEEALKMVPLAFAQMPEALFPLPKLPESMTAEIHIHQNCIPTYLPGHLERMDELHESLSQAEKSPLSVIGASYTGVSINDCVLYAKRTARRIIEAEEEGSSDATVTGLEEILQVDSSIPLQRWTPPEDS